MWSENVAVYVFVRFGKKCLYYNTRISYIYILIVVFNKL